MNEEPKALDPVARREARRWIHEEADCPDHVRLYVAELEARYLQVEEAYRQLREDAERLAAENVTRKLEENG